MRPFSGTGMTLMEAAISPMQLSHMVAFEQRDADH